MDLDTKLTNIHNSINESAKESLKAIGDLNTKMGRMEEREDQRYETYQKEMKEVKWKSIQDEKECKRRGGIAHTALDKVSSLEDADKARKKYFFFGVVTIIGLAVKAGWNFVFPSR